MEEDYLIDEFKLQKVLLYKAILDSLLLLHVF